MYRNCMYIKWILSGRNIIPTEVNLAMKPIFAIALLSLVVATQTASIVNNGKPACDTREQIETTFFRNNFDSTTYWVCVDLFEAVSQRCPEHTAFMDSLKSCVNWEDWEWEHPAY